ncbi:FAD-dependent oxidoreductase [Arthrobacter sp. I2-34]|uniref:FAD-dependent oxidoreductase n=1 Tax=Arthrobacter hankyongi TaxID=2904801 RepID=A0ABS9L9K5_9MICC|nr:FAD-dependent oxidoreductase [Arthrobacter hankyongi]MCG2623371.1 FAD-dependent oxidoreductase [Arthrobacter hankyongi]
MTEATAETFDAVVVGAGISGLSAALSAVEAGLRVALVEKTAAIGGSSAMSGGWFAFSGTAEQAAAGVRDSAEHFLADLLEVGGHANDRALLQAYLDNQAELYAWLKGRGVVFQELEISSGQSAARSHLTPIKEVLRSFADAFVAAGGTLLLDSRVTDLVRDGGRVSAVVVDTPDGSRTLEAAGGVVLASGGFSRGTDLLRIFAPEQLAGIPYGGLGNTGDGLKLAWKLGAGMADMSYISGTYGSHPETGIEFHELLCAYYLGAIIVNKDGKRFVDESVSYKTLGSACLDQPEGLGFEIFDAKVRAKSQRGVPLKDMDTLEDLGHVFKADSLEELARIAGIDAGALVDTVGRYNAVVAGREEDEFGRTGLCTGVGELLPIDQAPFYAYPAKTLMNSTYCGITINPQAQVLDVAGEVIEGLYAAGEVTGGFHGAAYMTGTSLGKGALFGRLAARSIAARVGVPA